MTDLLSTEEAAKALGLSIWTVRRLARSGDLPVVRPGRRAYRFRQADIEARLNPGRNDGS